MKRFAVALAASAALATAVAAPAVGAPVVGGEGAHPHHVMTGNGGCVTIDAVLFNPEPRGLHRASFASGGPSRGPWHGACP